MDILELSPTDYQNIVKTPFTIFDTVAFSSMNKHKVDEVKYLVFNDGKNRFGLIIGVQGHILKSPFSAPYACFSPISKGNKMSCYDEACKALVKYAKKLKMKMIRFTLPPTVYDENHIAKLYNSFYVSSFSIKGCDLNFQYALDSFDKNYQMSIAPKARQKLRASINNSLIFEVTKDIEAVYAVIKNNRDAKKYPLWMTISEIIKTMKIINTDLFLVYDENHTPIASAIIYYVMMDVVQVIYWGNLDNSDHLKPMNFLSFKVFEYYKNKNIKLFDVGPSTEFSKPNFGLCDFKQSIGCDASSKITFELSI